MVWFDEQSRPWFPVPLIAHWVSLNEDSELILRAMLADGSADDQVYSPDWERTDDEDLLLVIQGILIEIKNSDLEPYV